MFDNKRTSINFQIIFASMFIQLSSLWSYIFSIESLILSFDIYLSLNCDSHIYVKITVQWRIYIERQYQKFNAKDVWSQRWELSEHTRKNDLKINRCSFIIEHRTLYKQKLQIKIFLRSISFCIQFESYFFETQRSFFRLKNEFRKISWTLSSTILWVDDIWRISSKVIKMKSCLATA